MCTYQANQKAGGASDYSPSFYALGADPAELSRFTLSNIDNAPMFNPLSDRAVIPTGTSGIIPTGSYYESIAPLSINNTIGPPVPGSIQKGGCCEF